MTPPTRAALRDAVTTPATTLVYSFGCNPKAGFGADYLGFMAKLIWCLQHGVGFRFCTVHRPGGFITHRGWTDYFQPFCEEADGPLLDTVNLHAFPFARRLPVIKHIAGAWLRSTVRPRSQYFSFDALSQDLPVVQSPFNFDHYLHGRKQLIDLLWDYTPETAAEVRTIKQPFDSIGDYLAICIRRGDKLIEHEYVSMQQYVDKIKAGNHGTRTIFVATDDASVVDELQKALDGYQILSLAEPQSTGYVHASFKQLPASERRRRTLRFLATLELLRDAPTFIGSRTTNVSWMANAMRGGDGVEWVD